MKNSVFVPTTNDYSEPNKMIELAVAAEHAGWDGIFIWDHILLDPDGNIPILDPIVILSAIASRTNRIKIGTAVTPVARRRPWKLAKELATLDHLSNGRVILGVGLGGLDQEFANFGEESDKKILAKKTDEGLAIIEKLHKGERVDFEGEMYQLKNVRLLPRPVQRPRIPVWVAAMLPFKAGVRRAARWDGILAQKFPANMTSDTTDLDWHEMCLEPEELSSVVFEISKHRESNDPFNVIAFGTTVEKCVDDKLNLLQSYRDAGATWWFEWLNPEPGSYTAMLNYVEKGPIQLPKL